MQRRDYTAGWQSIGHFSRERERDSTRKVHPLSQRWTICEALPHQKRLDFNGTEHVVIVLHGYSVMLSHHFQQG